MAPRRDVYHPADYQPPEGSWASSEPNRKTMLANRHRDTGPELRVRRAVHAMGLRYRVATRPLKAVRRSADLVFTRAHVAVFVDGCFWHGCPEHGVMPKSNVAFWRDKLDGNRARDAKQVLTLRSMGWSVIRVWEHDLESDLASVTRTVLEVLKSPEEYHR